MPKVAIQHEAMTSIKVAMLESLVQDLLIDRFNSNADPVGAAMQYAETKSQPRPGAKIDEDLELARQAIWHEFLDSVVAAVRKAQGERM